MIRTFLTGNIVLMVVNLFVGILTTRLIGPTGRGIVALAIVWASIATYCLNCNVPVATSYFIPRMREAQRPRFVASVLLFAFVIGLIISGSFYALAPYIIRKDAMPYLIFMRQYILLAPIFALSDMSNNLLLAFKDNPFWSGVRVIQPIVTGVGLIFCLSVSHLTVPVALFLNGLSITITTFVMLGRLYCLVPFALPGELGLFWETLKYGLKSHATSLASALNGILDQLLIGSFIGAKELGLYSVAVNYTNLLSPVSTSLVVGTLPHLANMEILERKKAALAMSRKARSFLTLCALGLLMLAPIIPIVYKKEFAPSLGMAIILLPGVLLRANTGVLIRIILAFNQPLKSSFIEIIGLSVTALALAIFLPVYGAYGAAIASTLSYASSGVVATRVASHVLQVQTAALLTMGWRPVKQEKVLG